MKTTSPEPLSALTVIAWPAAKEVVARTKGCPRTTAAAVFTGLQKRRRYRFIVSIGERN